MNLKLESGKQEIPGMTLGRDGSEGLHPRKVGESTGRGDPRRFGAGPEGTQLGMWSRRWQGLRP